MCTDASSLRFHVLRRVFADARFYSSLYGTAKLSCGPKALNDFIHAMHKIK